VVSSFYHIEVKKRIRSSHTTVQGTIDINNMRSERTGKGSGYINKRNKPACHQKGCGEDKKKIIGILKVEIY
jgi:hypothetical protein